MARFARIYCPQGVFHIVSRTFNREFLISGQEERDYYLGLLEESLKKTDTLLLAWCLMSNHVHLVVRAGVDPLSRLMKSVHSGFAVWLNNHLGGRKGPVFSDRYKAILVEEETYLLELIRYVHNNPVRAGIVGNAKDSYWSSHRAYMGTKKTPEWLNSGWVLSTLSDDAKAARKMFSRFVSEGKKEKRRKDLNGEESNRAARKFQQEMGDGWRISGPIVGSDQFAAKVLEDIAKVDAQTKDTMIGGRIDASARERPSLDELIDVTCSVVDVESWEFEQQPKMRKSALARKLIVWLWVQRYGGIQAELARKLNASTSSVSKWYTKAVTQIYDLEELCDRISAQFPSFLARTDKPRSIRYNLEFED